MNHTYSIIYYIYSEHQMLYTAQCSPVTPGDWNFSAFLNWHLWPVKPSLHLN